MRAEEKKLWICELKKDVDNTNDLIYFVIYSLVSLYEAPVFNWER